MNQYEAMFLFDPTFGGSFENCEAEVRRLMGRAEAELLFCRKWDERRLAYRIKGRKRGVYVLVYFKAQGNRLAGLERDAQLSENILRVLILGADGVTPEMMEAAVASPGAERLAGGAADATPEAPTVTRQPGEEELEVEAKPIATETAVADSAAEEPDVDDQEVRTVD